MSFTASRTGAVRQRESREFDKKESLLLIHSVHHFYRLPVRMYDMCGVI